MRIRIALVALGLLCSCDRARTARLDLPGVMLWAWERPEDLSFIDSQNAGVAFLAARVSIAANGAVSFRMRTQDLTLPPGVAVLPVVRIDSPPLHAPASAGPILSGLKRIAEKPGVRGIQIDFDARRSERAFYQELLASTHQQIDHPVTVTALASWCAGDRWLDAEPVVEVVPMMFRMGRGESHDLHLSSPACRGSIGLSTDEVWPAARPASIKRIYLFSPHAWTQQEYRRALRRIGDWK